MMMVGSPLVVASLLSTVFGLVAPLRASAARSRRAGVVVGAGSKTGALLFDCDGVLVETEELHRLAYNEAFAAFGLETGGAPVEWSVAYYDVLQNTVGGGKPKMRFHFTETAKEWPTVGGMGGRETPTDEASGMALIDELQDYKTECYKKLVTSAKPRPGVLELMDRAIDDETIYVGICSASTRGGFEKVVDAVVGQDRLAKLDCIIAGDDVTNKKPDPEIYNLAAARLGVDNANCVVVEDSLVGLRAAKAAGMKCVITYTASTEREDFYAEGADAKLFDMSAGVEPKMLFADGKPQADLLAGLKD